MEFIAKTGAASAVAVLPCCSHYWTFPEQNPLQFRREFSLRGSFSTWHLCSGHHRGIS